jgi:hypothetical protein
LEELKKTYQGATTEIVYNQKQLVIKNMVEKLIIKGFEAVSRKQKETMSNAQRQLQEKVVYLEKHLQEIKTEAESERRTLKDQAMETTTECLHLKSALKVLEERHRSLELEKSRNEVMMEEKLKMAVESKTTTEKESGGRVRDMQAKLKMIEEQLGKSLSSIEKENALKDQKLQYLEKENASLLGRVESLGAESRQSLEKLGFFESQFKQSEVQVKLKDEEKKKEIEIVKEFFSKKVEESKHSENSALLEKQRQWEFERSFLQEQLSFS